MKKIILTPLIFLVGCLMLGGLIIFSNAAEFTFMRFGDALFLLCAVLLICLLTVGAIVYILNND